ncbi:hypothetical protein RUM43_008577 [Polyplax serrata]|uniref:Uncharacterized protein n=1 Tax=Polyplax serrata TaxID=468196 RepID=A0AAN8P608_POLSC
MGLPPLSLSPPPCTTPQPCISDRSADRCEDVQKKSQTKTTGERMKRKTVAMRFWRCAGGKNLMWWGREGRSMHSFTATASLVAVPDSCAAIPLYPAPFII